jgi:quinoprotein dehydrogenase-associated probable ABC transporter substrate-binding protein
MMAAATAMAPLAQFAAAECPCAAQDRDSAKSSHPTSAGVLRVCADPNNLPFSNRNHEGFEDKVAELLAKELDLTLSYDWLPQRLGFYRTALKTFDADLVMAAPAGFEKALPTKPYYRSTYVFVTRKGATTKTTPPMPTAPKDFDDPILKSQKIGVQLTGGITPAGHVLAKRNIIDNIVGFPVFDETNGAPGERIVNAVAAGEIDVAIMWGPQAGYFAKRQKKAELDVKPVAPETDGAGREAIPLTFGICMAVRRGNEALRDKLDAAVVRRRADIDRILDDFNIPRLPLKQEEVGLPPRR